MNDSYDVSTKLDALPDGPGVYLLKDATGAILYVGKANRLRSRVRTYFSERGGADRRLLPFLRARLADFDVLSVVNEKEALLLENSLIKQHKPRYNVRLLDDKTYLSLRLDRRHPYPRFTTARKRRADGARYFGPYSSARAIRSTLKLLYRAFGIRSCSDSVLANRTRPCLYYQIGQCLAPCVGLVSEPDYAAALSQAEMLLDGRDGELLRELHQAMSSAAADERFEDAAKIRDRLRAVQRSLERQSVSLDVDHDFDVVGHGEDGGRHAFVWLHVRDGRVIDTATLRVQDRGRHDIPDLMLSVLLSAYEKRRAPAEIVVSHEPRDHPVLEQVLSERRGARVRVLDGSRGAKRRLVALASRNASAQARLADIAREQPRSDVVAALRDLLALPRLPRRIDCFDISHLGGTLTVGAMAVVRDGEADPDSYRRYRLRAAMGGDDFAGLREVLSRRLARGLDEGDLPDLLVLDGGPGQLAVGLSVREELGIEDLPVIALAKGPDRNAGRELIHLPGRDPLALPHDDPRLHLLQRLRDESHRFAVTYQRGLRRQRDLGSVLEAIPGVGPARRRALLTTFGSVAAVRRASLAELASTPGIGRKAAQSVFERLRSVR